MRHVVVLQAEAAAAERDAQTARDTYRAKLEQFAQLQGAVSLADQKVADALLSLTAADKQYKESTQTLKEYKQKKAQAGSLLAAARQDG